VGARAQAEAGFCPLCSRGPWPALTKHVSRAHGVLARDFKASLGIPVSRSLDSSEVRAALSALGKRRGAPPGLLANRADHSREAVAERAGDPTLSAGRRAKVEHMRAIQPIGSEARRRIPLDALPRIRQRIAQGERLTDIGRDFGVTPNAIRYAVRAHP